MIILDEYQLKFILKMNAIKLNDIKENLFHNMQFYLIKLNYFQLYTFPRLRVI